MAWGFGVLGAGAGYGYRVAGGGYRVAGIGWQVAGAGSGCRHRYPLLGGAGVGQHPLLEGLY